MGNIIFAVLPWALDTGELLDQLAAQQRSAHATGLHGFVDMKALTDIGAKYSPALQQSQKHTAPPLRASHRLSDRAAVQSSTSAEQHQSLQQRLSSVQLASLGTATVQEMMHSRGRVLMHSCTSNPQMSSLKLGMMQCQTLVHSCNGMDQAQSHLVWGMLAIFSSISVTATLSWEALLCLKVPWCKVGKSMSVTSRTQC